MTTAHDVETVVAKVEEHAELSVPEDPVTIEVTVGLHPEGFVGVCFPDGVPPHELVNLLRWLDDSTSSVAFLTAPSSGVRYALYSDASNEAGDTVLGTRADGTCVEVYLPDGTVRYVAQALSKPEPSQADVSATQRFTITVDRSYGNPGFHVEGDDLSWPLEEGIDRVRWHHGPADVRAAYSDREVGVSPERRGRNPLTGEAIVVHGGLVVANVVPAEGVDVSLTVRFDGDRMESLGLSAEPSEGTDAEDAERLLRAALAQVGERVGLAFHPEPMEASFRRGGATVELFVEGGGWSVEVTRPS